MFARGELLGHGDPTELYPHLGGERLFAEGQCRAGRHTSLEDAPELRRRDILGTLRVSGSGRVRNGGRGGP